MDVQHEYHRCRLRAVIDQFVAHAEFHGVSPMQSVRGYGLPVIVNVTFRALANALREDDGNIHHFT
jgi:hypothetical protein